MNETRTLSYLTLLILALAVFVVFLPVLSNQFLGWDDSVNVYENPYYHPVTMHNVLRLWLSPYQDLYIPLTYTVWAAIATVAWRNPVEGAGFDLNPGIFHAANLVTHILSSFVVFGILKLLLQQKTGRAKRKERKVDARIGYWAVGLGTLVFALHPLQVEAVAWVTGMKDSLSGLLSLVAIWQYLCYARRTIDQKSSVTGRLNYVIGLIAFVLALLAKPNAVAAPIVAWILSVWMLERPVRRTTLDLTSWAALAVGWTIITRLIQPTSGLAFIPKPWLRPLIAGDALAFYLYKFIAPLGLAVDYGRSPQFVLRHEWIYFTWLIPVGLAALIWVLGKRTSWRAPAASFGVFVAWLLPVLGLASFTFQNYSTVADRYVYVSMLGPALLVGWLVSRWETISIKILCLAILCALGISSNIQARHWRDDITLFGYTLKVNKNSFLAHGNLGAALALEGRSEEAIENYREAIRLNPGYGEAHNNLAGILGKQGKIDEAIFHIKEALRIDPNNAGAHYNMGMALSAKGKIHEAIAHYREVVRINPNDADAQFYLGAALGQAGKLDETIVHLRKACNLDPHNGQFHFNLALAFYLNKQYAEAWEEILISQKCGFVPDPRVVSEISRKIGTGKR